MSVTNLSKLDALNVKLNAFSDALLKAGGLQDKTLRAAYESTLRFDDADQMDLGDFAKRISNGTKDPSLKAAADQLLASIAETTVEKGAKGSGGGRYTSATGLSIYGPRGAVDGEYKKPGVSWLGSRWNDLISTYNKVRVS